MAKKKRERKMSAGANWMDTYADMVTLLLCFFVLLLSAADQNSEKWEILVRSLNPNAEQVSQIVDQMAETPGDYPVDGGAEKPPQEDIVETLYYALKKYVEQNNLESSVDVQRGAGYEFITFDSTIFFQANSYDIQPTGKQVLDGLVNVLAPVAERIDELKILGHTSQASADAAYDLHYDRFLASNRANAVLLYLQDKYILPSSKLISIGYGQYRPIAGFDTAEGRAKNRRVEMMISVVQPNQKDAIEQYYDSRQAKGQEAEDWTPENS